MSPKPSLDGILSDVLARREAKSQRRRLTVVPPNCADFSSNAYLSLATREDIQREYVQRFQAEVDGSTSNLQIGGVNPPLLGSGGSRLLDGNSDFAENLEHEIASFHRAQAGLLFNSGFDANVGLFSCVPQPQDTIVYDELIHASVHDGMRASRAKRTIPFAHNQVGFRSESVQEQPLSNPNLATVIKNLTSEDEQVRSGARNVFIAVEGVYSMDGDVAPLQEIVECVEALLPHGNGYIIVDEAHSTGIIGERGRGLVCALGLERRVWARLHTFGKAMSCSGAIVLCSPVAREYLINYARSLIYTTALPFTVLASIQTTYSYLDSGKSKPLLDHLWALVHETHALLLQLIERHKPDADTLRVDRERRQSPILPVYTSHPRSLAQFCQQRGSMVRPIVAPTVPLGKERIRVCLHAGNTVEEVHELVASIEAWVIGRLQTHGNTTALSLGGIKSRI